MFLLPHITSKNQRAGTMAISFSWSAATKLTWMLVLLLTVIQVHGQSTSGFINIDCGWKNGSTYIDDSSIIAYIPDGEFVDSGLSQEILPEFMTDATNEQQKTLRSFPKGSRNCYTLPATVGKKYLLRAYFTYGNYDRLNRSLDGSLFLFGLHIGVNLWQKVNLTNLDPSSTMFNEVLTIARGNNLSVCLVNFGSGTPFVSTLELRTLEDAMYPFVNTSVSVRLIERLRFGNITDYLTRYPTDHHDRFWMAWSQTVDYTYPWISLNTSRTVNMQQSTNVFQVPQHILQNASTVDTNYSSMLIAIGFSPNMDIKNLELLPIFHFAEIASSSANRTFNVYSNHELLFSGVSLLPMQVQSMYPTDPFLSGINDMFFVLNKTASSALPPLINALELYSVIRMENFTTSPDDVAYINEVKKQYSVTTINWNGDPCSPREYTWEGLTCDYSSANQNPRIVRVNMATRGLIGGLAISFFNMESLEYLDLSNNSLTGVLPDYQLKSIKVIDLSSNKIDGPIPDSILQRVQAGVLDLRLEGNPVCSNRKDTYCSSKKQRNTTPILLTAVIVPVVLITLLVGLCTLWKLYFKEKSENEDYAMYEEETPLHIDIRRFTYAELKLITKNFQSIIGKGGFGIVYHGILENGDEVAVKVLKETSVVDSTDFLPEVQILSKVHHKNLVTLQGYCQNKKCLALVYDFMPRGNLKQVLRGGEDYSLNWEQRLRIAFDAAQGLGYLHELCTPSIVHRDVKTPNILLDKNLVGILSDFGLSRVFNDAHTHISTRAAGTPGYIDPEYHATFQLTVKTDVYSFGIVLLEIITGQPPVIMDPHTIHLPIWVRQKIAKGNIHDVVDKNMLDQYDVISLEGVIDLAMNCVENAAVDRPTMTEVISRLKVWLPKVSSEKHDVSRTPPYKSSVDTEIPHHIQSGYTGGMSEISMFSGR
ncbi:unnamed protein product [Alopecurus aequalis]